MMAGPPNCAAAAPVSTKMPAPMIAPIPSVTRLVAPSARLRLCSPASDASTISASSGFVAKRFAIQFFSLGLLFTRLLRIHFCISAPSPHQVHGNAHEHDDEPGP